MIGNILACLIPGVIIAWVLSLLGATQDSVSAFMTYWSLGSAVIILLIEIHNFWQIITGKKKEEPIQFSFWFRL